MSKLSNSPYLVVHSHSKATSWNLLQRDIQDALVDLWYHPRVLNRTNHQAGDQCHLITHLQVAAHPTLFSPTTRDPEDRDMDALCQWLRDHHVAYEIGFVATSQGWLRALPKALNPQHRLVLRCEVIR